MRDIKFRCWDNGNMDYSPDVFEPYECSCHGVNINYALEITKSVFMQYTGLKDKNGLEIYEDDWVKFRDRLFRIKWDRYKWQFFNKKGGMPVSQIVNNLAECEVIGNTYSNPELFNN